MTKGLGARLAMRPCPEGGGVMSTLKEVLQQAERRRVAVGHFNFSELVASYALKNVPYEVFGAPKTIAPFCVCGCGGL